MERCPNCGASIRTGARFCTACGFRLVQPADVPASTDPVATVLDPSPSGAPEPTERIVWHGEQPDATSSAERSEAVASTDSAPEIAPPTSADNDSGADIASSSLDSGSGSWSSESDVEDRERRLSTMVEAEDGRDRPDQLEADDRSPDAPASMDAQPETVADNSVKAASPEPTDHPDDSPAASVEQPEREVGGSDAAPPSDDMTSAQPPDDDRTGGPLSSVQGDEGDQQATGVSSPWKFSSAESSDAPQMQDDVVPGTTFVQESAQPGYYDDAGERPSLTGDVTRAPNGAEQPVDVETVDIETVDVGASDPPVTSAETGLDTSSDAESMSTGDRSGGMDSDWEPWGGGTAPAEPTVGGTDTTLRTMFSDPTTAAMHDQGDTDPESSKLARARKLLDELSTVMATIGEPVDQPAVDPASRAAVESMAELGQLFDGFPYPTLDPDRVGELSQLAEDLSGRDYDIRALQRFAQERDLILELTVGFEQQRDLLEQIRSILTQAND